MGSKSSNKSKSSSTTVDLTSTLADNRIGGDNALIEGNLSVTAGQNIDNLAISKTDFGAIEAAGDFAREALDVVRDSVIGSFTLADAQFADNRAALNTAIQEVKSLSSDSQGVPKPVVYGGAALAVAAGLALASRK